MNEKLVLLSKKYIPSFDTIDKLAHAAKNVSKVIECCEDDGYSNYGGYSRRDVSENYVRPDGSYRDGGMSYARGRGPRAARDSMGRYSRDGYSYDDARDDMIRELRELMNDAPDEQTKKEFQRFISKMESM